MILTMAGLIILGLAGHFGLSRRLYSKPTLGERLFRDLQKDFTLSS